MAHFARISGNVVVDIHAVADLAITDSEGEEREHLGQELLSGIFGGTWAQCSYNANFRGCYPGLGFGFDGVNFIPPAIEEI